MSSEVGIGAAVGFGIAYHLVFMAFHRVRRVTTVSAQHSHARKAVPMDTQVFSIHQSMLFFNAYHIKSQILDSLQTYSSGDPITLETANKNRNWSVAGLRRAKVLRTKADIIDEPVQIRRVVIDLKGCWNVDTTGLTALRDLVEDVKRFGGKGVHLGFVGVSERVGERFGRFGWRLHWVEGGSGSGDKEGTMVYESVEDAVFGGGRKGDMEIEEAEIRVVGGDKEKV